jgi:hypothetical protein
MPSTNAASTKGGRLRRWTAPIAVVLACACFVGAIVGIWARRNFLDTDRFVDRTAPIVEEPAVQNALTERLTDQLMVLIDPRAFFEEALPERGRLLAIPLTNAVEGFVRDRVATFIASDTFDRLFVGIVERAHRGAVRLLRDQSEVIQTSDGTITLNLVPVIDEVLQQITSASPEILGREVNLPDITVDSIPEEAISRLEGALDQDLDDEFGQVTVYSKGRLEGAQEGLQLFDRAVILLAVATVLFAIAAIWISPRRRRTVLQLAVGGAIGVVLLRRVVFRLREDVAAIPPREEGQEVARSILDQFLDPLVIATAVILVVLLLVLAVALLTGSYPWAVRVRSRATDVAQSVAGAASERARDESTVAWVHAHVEHLQIAGAVVGVLALWWLDLSWFGVIALFIVVGLYELALLRIRRPSDEQSDPVQPGGVAPT